MKKIIDSFPKNQVEIFESDFLTFFDLCVHLDREYDTMMPYFESNVEVMKEYIENFQKKYVTLRVDLIKDSISIKPAVFFPKEQDLKEMLMKTIINMRWFKGAGLTYGQCIEPKDKDQFSVLVNSIKDKLYVHFSGYEEDVLILKIDQGNQMVQIIFEKQEIIDDSTPEFLICAYYALSEEFYPEIDLNRIKSKFKLSSYSKHDGFTSGTRRL